MQEIKMPKYLHDVFGERQTPLIIFMIFLFGGGSTAVLFFTYPAMIDQLPAWRSILLLILVFDIFCGAIANFTRSTNNYYAERPNQRHLFIAVHFHVLLIAFLAGTNIWQTAVVWGYTIACAFIVNVFIGKHIQRFLGGFFLCIGLIAFPLLPDLEPFMLIICQLFMVKVLYSFAVDHYGKIELS